MKGRFISPVETSVRFLTPRFLVRNCIIYVQQRSGFQTSIPPDLIEVERSETA